MDQRIYTARAMQTPALVCSLPALSLMNNSTSAAALTSPAPGRRQHPSRIDSKHTVALGARALIAPRGGESGALERGGGGKRRRACGRERESRASGICDVVRVVLAASTTAVVAAVE